MGDLTFLSSVVPYTRDFLLGFFPLVVLYEALKASSPFRGRALIWYIGVIASVYLVVNANIPALLTSWSVHTTLLAIGYVVGVYWWIRPREKKDSVFDWATFDYYSTLAYTRRRNRRSQ